MSTALVAHPLRFSRDRRPLGSVCRPAVEAADHQTLVRTLVDLLTPVVQARVARSLLASGRARGRDARQEVADLTQDVFVALFADDGRQLRGWDPSKGLTLKGFVGFVTERQCLSMLRTARRNPWTEDPTLDAGADLPDVVLERRVESRQTLTLLFDRMKQALSPLGRSLFQQLLVEQRAASEVCEQTKMSRDAVYAWQSRLTKLLKTMRAELEADAPAEEKRDE